MKKMAIGLMLILFLALSGSQATAQGAAQTGATAQTQQNQTVNDTAQTQPAVSAQEVSSDDLIDRAAELDGQTVVYTGEVIGDILPRGDHTWLNISDGSNAIGAWVQTAAIGDVTLAGRYDRHGDEVRVTGVFHRACREHGGDLDIHADTVELVSAGYAVTHAVQPWRIIAAAVLAVSAVLLLGKWLKRKKRL